VEAAISRSPAVLAIEILRFLKIVSRDGNCGGPAQEIALLKDTPTPYRRQLTARTIYNDWNSERALWTAPPDFGFWHYYVLHVYFDHQNVCNNGNPCNWDSPNGGAIEFWVDGVWQGYWAMITLYMWPDRSACVDDDPYYPRPVGPMNSYLKHGLYRDFYLTSDNDRVFHCCYESGNHLPRRVELEFLRAITTRPALIIGAKRYRASVRADY
jgi:hypothetical protein